MSTISLKKQVILDSPLYHSSCENFYLKIFIYLTRIKRDKIEHLLPFLQKYKLKFGFITKDKRFYFSHYFQGNANFIIQSTQPISPSDFVTISCFLSSEVIIVSFFYQNQI